MRGIPLSPEVIEARKREAARRAAMTVEDYKAEARYRREQAREAALQKIVQERAEAQWESRMKRKAFWLRTASLLRRRG